MAMPLESVTIADEQAGTTAKILVGFGFNCYSFQVSHGDGEREVLWAAADFESGRQRASGSGIPVLFPFPGRIRGGTFSFGGRRYDLKRVTEWAMRFTASCSIGPGNLWSTAPAAPWVRFGSPRLCIR